jgi:hypothetical protein
VNLDDGVEKVEEVDSLHYLACPFIVGVPSPSRLGGGVCSSNEYWYISEVNRDEVRPVAQSMHKRCSRVGERGSMNMFSRR